MSQFRIEHVESGQMVWRLVGDDGAKLADSGGEFATEEAARAAVEAVRRAAPTADVVSSTQSETKIVDEASDDSFPASDPPSSWAAQP